MKVTQYQQMMAYLMRPKFNGGGPVSGNFVKPKKKPEKEVKKRKKENFEKVKDALENPDEVKKMIDKPKRGLVDEPGSYAGAADVRAFLEKAEKGSTIDVGKFLDDNTTTQAERRNLGKEFKRIEKEFKDKKLKIKMPAIGRKAKLEGKTGQIVEALQDLPKGSQIDLVKLTEDLKLGEYGSSLIKKIIAAREELKNKDFKSVTKTDKSVKKINEFIENYVKTNDRLPTQGEIRKGAQVDSNNLKRYIAEGKVQEIAKTSFEQNRLAAEYILNSDKPTLKGLEEIIGNTPIGTSEKQGRNLVRSAKSLATRVYVNSLKSLTNKLTGTDEVRSVYKNFSVGDVEAIKNKVRQIPGFTSYYEREITDLVADAYKNDEAKKTKALKKIAQFKKINETLSKKFKFGQVLDHPLAFDFVNKAAEGVDPEELIRVRPLPGRVNAFKTFLDERVPIITEGLKKNPGSQQFISMRDDVMSIADELKIPFPKISNKGTIITPAAAKIGDKPIQEDVRRAGQVQNAFRKFVQNISNDPRIQRLGININKLKDLSKLPKVDLKAYDKAVSDFVKKSGKFGFAVAAPYLAATKGPEFARKLGLVDRDFEQTAAVGEVPITEKPVSLGEKALYGGAGAGAAAVGTKTGRSLLGKAFRTLGTPLAGTVLAGTQVASNIGKGENIADAVIDPIVGLELSFPGLFRENISKITSNPRVQQLLTLGKFGRALTPVGLGITAAGAGVDLAKFTKDRINQLRSMSPVERDRLRQESDAFSFNEFSAAGGGIAKLAGKSSGRPPESGPTPQGLDFLLKRGRKY